MEMQRKIVYSGLGRSRKLRTHRRQLSDPKIHLDIHPIKEDGSIENGYEKVSFFLFLNYINIINYLQLVYILLLKYNCDFNSTQ